MRRGRRRSRTAEPVERHLEVIFQKSQARANAVAIGRARAEAYARSLGLRVVRIVAVSESGGYAVPPPMPPVVMMARMEAQSTKIEPGEQKLQVSLAMTFELQ